MGPKGLLGVCEAFPVSGKGSFQKVGQVVGIRNTQFLGSEAEPLAVSGVGIGMVEC